VAGVLVVAGMFVVPGMFVRARLPLSAVVMLVMVVEHGVAG
jgi:hypothetical protein